MPTDQSSEVRKQGLAGRLLVMFAGLACPLLYITGMVRWLQKRRVASCKQKAANKAYSAEEMQVKGGF